jgi:hypothetical protein
MKITREVNGQTVEFELTDKEMLDTFFEQQEAFDAQDVVMLIEHYSEEEFVEKYGVSPTVILENSGEIGSRMRRNIDKYDMDWESARDEAVSDWCSEQGAS